jgi:hypothetical protein
MSSEDYRDPSLSAGVRAELVLRQMTLEEKCDQLTAGWPWLLVRADGSDAEGAGEVLTRARVMSRVCRPTTRPGWPCWSAPSSDST